MPKNVIEYKFEGNVLDLEQAIKQVESLLRKSVKALKTYQDGVLDAEQATQVKSTRALLRQLRAQKKLGRAATEEEAKRANVAGNQALKTASALYKKSLRVTKQGEAKLQKAAEEAREKAQERAQQISDATSIAGQEQASQRSFFLGSYADQLKGIISPEAYSEIQRVVADFAAAQKAFREGKISQEELADATIRVDEAYKDYSSTLKNAKNAQQAASRGIQDLKTMMAALEQQMTMTVQSLYFWTNLLRKVAQSVKEGITLYADYVESLNFLQRASGDAADAMKEFADEQIRAFGLDPTDVATAAAIFYSFADSMGFASEQSELLSKNMTKLAQDIASLQNIDVEEAAIKLRSALAGQSKALATLGVNVNDANVEEWLLTKGLKKSMKQMNETSQAAARYAFILEKTASAQGDLANTLGSPANQLKILNAQSALLVQNLGALGTTLFLPLVKLLNQILLPFNAFVRGLTSISASGFSSSVGEAGDNVDGLTDSLEEASDAAKGLTGIDEINQFENTQVVNQQLGLDTDIEQLLTGYDNLATEASALVPIFEALGTAMAPIWDMLGNETNVSLLTGVLESLVIVLWPIQKLLEGIGWVINLLPKPLRDVVGLFAEAAIAMTTLVTILATAKTLMASKVFTTFATTFKAISSAMMGAIKTGITWIATTVKMIAQSIATGIKNLWEAGTWWAKAAAIVAAAGIGAVAVAAVVGAGVAIVSAAQSRSTPKLATGGVTTGPTFAMIGEGKYDEAVVPLGNSPQFAEMKNDIANEVLSKMGSGGHGGSRQATPIILNLNGKEIARALLPDLGYAQPQTGVRLTR